MLASSKKIPPDKQRKGRPANACGFVSMATIASNSVRVIEARMKERINPTAHIITDGGGAYVYTKQEFGPHIAAQGTPQQRTKLLPWVHIAISNAKRKFLDVHHSVSHKYLQRYLDEFCFKINRRNTPKCPLNALLNQAVQIRRVALVRSWG